MLADEFPERDILAPQSMVPSPVTLLLYVPDVDATVRHAFAAGAVIKRPVQDQFYGDRTAGIADPFGHIWHIATHIEDVSVEEIQRRAAAQSHGR
jgi:PhnB protein